MNWHLTNNVNAHLWTACTEFTFIWMLASALHLSVLPTPSGVGRSVHIEFDIWWADEQYLNPIYFVIMLAAVSIRLRCYPKRCTWLASYWTAVLKGVCWIWSDAHSMSTVLMGYNNWVWRSWDYFCCSVSFNFPYKFWHWIVLIISCYTEMKSSGIF